MPKTYTFSVDNVGNAEPIIAQSNCQKILLCENARAATTDFNVYAPRRTDPAIRYAAGEICTFESPFNFNNFYKSGQTVGYIETITGTVTFRQLET